jgi:2,4-dienoyl-CoA reductase-like NADH-dependent reductase (Old Yellow Enzyme family)
LSVLTDPWAVGSRTAPSRVLFGPHCTNLGTGRAFSVAHERYYGRRARGGCGVIVTETISVDETDWPYERAPLATVAVDSLARVAAAVHAEGALVVASLGHCGLQGSTTYSQDVLVAPSLVPHVLTHEMPLVPDGPGVTHLVTATVAAAVGAMHAGCDGVELNAGQFSLFRQFLSGLTNLRDDEWADRPRLVRVVMDALRTALGDAVLGLRVVGDELAPWAGITPDQSAAWLPEVAAHADYVVVERGSIFSEAATRSDMRDGTNVNGALLAHLRASVPASVALVAQGSIVDPVAANELLSRGRCDAVEMTRAQIADPDLVARVRGVVAGAVRPCTLCNQGCLVRDVRNPLVSCAVNPVAGYEGSERGDVGGDDLVGHAVTVAGAGPAGLEAARVLASRGARVTVVERSAQVGGALALAAALPGRDRWMTLVAWYEEELARLGVTVQLGERATAADLVATGAQTTSLRWRDGDDGSVTVTSVRAHLTEAVTGSRIAVLDPVGGPIGVGVAEQLALAGRTVWLVTPDLVAGTQLSLTGDLVAANARLAHANVTLVLHHAPVGIREGALVLEDRYGGAVASLEVDTVIDAGFEVPLDDPPTGVPLGDAVAPRSVNAAVREGRRAGVSYAATGAGAS